MIKSKRNALMSTSLVAIVAVGLSGCAENMMGDLESQVSQLKTQVSEKDGLLKAAQATAQAAQAAQARAEEMARKSAMTPKPVAAVATGRDLPPNAKAGECYARVFLPAKYKSITETLMVRQEAERIQVRPAVYRPATKRVLFKAASERLRVIPAKYGWVEERILVKPAGEELITEAPVYETATDRILVKPAYTTWKKGRGPIQKVNQATGEIMCLVEVPAEYRSVSKRVLKTPARTRTVTTAAVYKTVKKRVVVTPASTRAVTIPAEYRNVRIRELIQGAQEKRIKIPAQFRTVTKSEKISEGKIDWRPILCETNTTKGVVQRLQIALKGKGFNPGKIDGVIGTDTMQAVKAYQKSEKQASGQLTLETLKSLGVSL